MFLAKQIIKSKKPFVLFHTYVVTEAVLRQAIGEGKSMDLDVCVDDGGNPYLGHSKEFYEKSGEAQPRNMAFADAVEILAKSDIPLIVDCKHINAWPVVEKMIAKLGASRCLVHAFANELEFDFSRKAGEPDYLTEWQPIEKLRLLKNKFLEISTCVSCKWLPDDLLVSDKYEVLLKKIRQILKNNRIDTLCLNVPNETFSDKWLKFFLQENIILHVGIDDIDTSKLSELYIGETDHLERASKNLV